MSKNPICPDCNERMRRVTIKHHGDTPEDSWTERLWECGCAHKEAPK
jgi:hypothetical protein